MTTRVRKVITAVDSAGVPFSEVHTETLVGNRWMPNDPTSLADAGPEAAAWKSQFNAAVSAQFDALKAQHAAAQAELATLTTARDAGLQTIASLTEQVETIPSLTERIAALTAERDELQSRVPPQPGPREVSPREFLARISDADKIAIMSSRDPRCMAAMWTLFTTLSVDLDSPILAELVDALIDAGIEIDETERERMFA